MIPTYTTFQCSVCRRYKDIILDNVHVVPNKCTITKGCSGKLSPVGVTTSPSSTPNVNGLTNWYPRGSKPVPTPVVPAEETYSLSTSSTGVVTLALFIPDATAFANETVVVALNQEVDQAISYVEYNYNVAVTPTTIIQGRDSNGKNLRFTSAQIAASQVFVLVNGVERFPGTGATEFVISPNVITFNSSLSMGDIVEVSVYTAPPAMPQSLTFTINNSFLVNDSSGAWGNIRWVKSYADNGTLNTTNWWVYSCTSLGNVGISSRLILTGIFEADGVTPIVSSLSDARFLLATPPYDNPDRYLNFYIDCSLLADGYALSTQTETITELFADEGALVEFYPPFQLLPNANQAASSYVTDDVFPTSDGVSSTTSVNTLTSSLINGPV